MKFDFVVKQVIKRDLSIVDYDRTKILGAIKKAVLSVGKSEYIDNESEEKQVLYTDPNILTNFVENEIEVRFKTKKIPTVEELQDVVEYVLIKHSYAVIAKAYIIYRNKHSSIRQDEALLLDIEKTMDEYLGNIDWRILENASTGYSLGGLILNNSGAITANYWLSKIYPDYIGNSHRDGDFHIHDLSMLSSYCCGHSLRELITEGVGGVTNKISSKPAKHLSTLVNQMVNYIGILQNEFAGAQAFSSFDTYLAPFVRVDNLSYDQVKQCIQTFIFGVNTPSRWATQAPFSNITLDWSVPDDLKDFPVIVGGKTLNTTYGDYQKEMDMINKAFLEVMGEGDGCGVGFAYPIPTYNITENFNWDSDNAKLLFESTGKYGYPYFQNFLNSDLKPSDVRSMCCRLSLSLKELTKRGGGLFGANEKTGSIGVVTLNMARIGYLSSTKEEYYSKVETLMDYAKQSLEIKRKCINKFMDNGLYPYTKRYIGSFKTFFSTIGLNGMNESMMNFMGKTMGDKEAIDFTIELLNFMKEKLITYQEETGNLYNLEATPAEGCGYRLAKIDKKKYPDIITSGETDPFYTNSTQLPVNYTDDLFEALDLQEDIQCAYSGGTVVHCFIGESIEDYNITKNLVKKIASNYKIPYFTISPTFSICSDHGYQRGEIDICPQCGKKNEIFKRIVGYYRSVTNWNLGKKSENSKRIPFDVPENIKDELLHHNV